MTPFVTVVADPTMKRRTPTSPTSTDMAFLQATPRPPRKTPQPRTRLSASSTCPDKETEAHRRSLQQLREVCREAMHQWRAAQAVFFLQSAEGVTQETGWWFYPPGSQRFLTMPTTYEPFIYARLETSPDLQQLPLDAAHEGASLPGLPGYVWRIVAIDGKAVPPEESFPIPEAARHAREVMRKQEQHKDTMMPMPRLRSRFAVLRTEDYTRAEEEICSGRVSSARLDEALALLESPIGSFPWWLAETVDEDSLARGLEHLRHSDAPVAVETTSQDQPELALHIETLPKISNPWFSVALASARKSARSASIATASVWEPLRLSTDREGGGAFRLLCHA